MKRSKKFWFLLWLVFTSGGFLSGYLVGKTGSLRPKKDLLVITSFPEFITPSFQIYFFEKYKTKLIVQHSPFDPLSKNVHFTELSQTPAQQTATAVSYDSIKLSPHFATLAQDYPQFFPLFWRVEGSSPNLELKIYGFWIPEDYTSPEFSNLLLKENIQEWLDSSAERSALNPQLFKIDDTRSSKALTDYTFTELRLVRPQK